MPALAGIVLWLHVVCGVAWIGACAGLVVASYGLANENSALAALILRAAPQINRLGIVCGGLIVLTGLGNLAFVSARRRTLPEEFAAIVLAKVALLALMGFAWWRVIEEFSTIRKSAAQAVGPDFHTKSRALLRWYEAVIAAGLLALALGLWLAGV